MTQEEKDVFNSLEVQLRRLPSASLRTRMLMLRDETLTFLQSTSSDVTNNIIYTRYEYGPYTLRTESYTSISSLSFEDRKDGIWPTLHQETLYKGKSTVATSMLDRIYTTKEVEVLVDKIAHIGGRNE